MKINDSLSVVRYLNKGLSLASLGVDNLASSVEDGFLPPVAQVRQLSDFICDMYITTNIALKLIDPDVEDKKLNSEEKKFLSKFYFTTDEEILTEEP